MTTPVTMTRCPCGSDKVRPIDEPCPGCGAMVPGQGHQPADDPSLPAQALHYSSAVIWDRLMGDRDERGPHARPAAAVADAGTGAVSQGRGAAPWHD